MLVKSLEHKNTRARIHSAIKKNLESMSSKFSEEWLVNFDLKTGCQ